MYMALIVLCYQNDRSPSSKPKEIREISKKKKMKILSKYFLRPENMLTAS